MKKFDLIIIGAGRASNLATRAGKAGKKVAIIEKSTLGGTCPNRGCVPSKLLLGYAHVANAIKESNRHFIDSSINNIDVKKIFEQTNNYTLVDLGAQYQINKNIEYYLGVDNIFNKEVDEEIGTNVGSYYFTGLRITF